MQKGLFLKFPPNTSEPEGLHPSTQGLCEGLPVRPRKVTECLRKVTDPRVFMGTATQMHMCTQALRDFKRAGLRCPNPAILLNPRKPTLLGTTLRTPPPAPVNRDKKSTGRKVVKGKWPFTPS